MASTCYAKAKESWLDNTLDLNDGDIRALFIDGADYTPNFTTDDFLADVPAPARIGTATALANTTVTDGVFDADNTTMAAVTGDQFEHILLYLHTGSDATAKLVCLIDVAATTPNGGDIEIQWDNGASKIFRITG
jgi:hypothetical protein